MGLTSLRARCSYTTVWGLKRIYHKTGDPQIKASVVKNLSYRILKGWLDMDAAARKIPQNIQRAIMQLWNVTEYKSINIGSTTIEALARDPKTPEPVLSLILKRHIRNKEGRAVSENPVIIQMLQAAKESASIRVLAELSRKPFPCVREEAAKNPNISPVTLKTLSKDKIWDVRLAAAKNPNCLWPSVAEVISGFKKEAKMIHYGEENKIAAAFDSDADTCGRSYQAWGYFEDSVALVNEILDIHAQKSGKIKERLRILNKKLFKALIQTPF